MIVAEILLVRRLREAAHAAVPACAFAQMSRGLILLHRANDSSGTACRTLAGDLPSQRNLLSSAAMIVMFRLIAVVISSLFKRRIGALEEAVITMRCWPNDLDLNFHMNSGRYVSIMDVGRISILCRYGIFLRIMRIGWRPIAGATMIRYRRSLLAFEKFQVRSRVVCWDAKWFYFEHIIEKDGALCAVGHVRGVLRGPDGNIPPARFLEVAGAGGIESPEMPEYIRLWNEAEALR